jgi:hypothetical protein
MVELCPICKGSEWGVISRIPLLHFRRKCPACGTPLKARVGTGVLVWTSICASVLLPIAWFVTFYLTFALYTSLLIAVGITLAVQELVIALVARVEDATQAKDPPHQKKGV